MKTTITDYLPEARRPRFKDFEQTEEQRELFIRRLSQAKDNLKAEERLEAELNRKYQVKF